jgi:hypothetical protein
VLPSGVSCSGEAGHDGAAGLEPAAVLLRFRSRRRRPIGRPYVFAPRSHRQLCPEVQVNLAYRWFCGLGLEDAILNHSAASRASTRPAARSRVIFTRMVATWPVPRLEL